jgi:hypothetical protein
VTQYFVLTASELSTSSLGPPNQDCAEISHTTRDASRIATTAAEAKLKFWEVKGYTKGNIKSTDEKISQRKAVRLIGVLHLHNRHLVLRYVMDN